VIARRCFRGISSDRAYLTTDRKPCSSRKHNNRMGAAIPMLAYDGVRAMPRMLTTIQGERPHHRRLAATAVAIPADHDPAEGPREEAHAKGSEGIQQAPRAQLRGKEGMTDLDREEN